MLLDKAESEIEPLGKVNDPPFAITTDPAVICPPVTKFPLKDMSLATKRRPLSETSPLDTANPLWRVAKPLVEKRPFKLKSSLTLNTFVVRVFKILFWVYSFTMRFPTTVKSFPIITFPLRDASPPTASLLVIFASPPVTDNPAAAVNKPLVVMVLLVRVSKPSTVAKVWFPVGTVIVPEFDIEEITGPTNVLLVSVSVVARPTKVSVDVGRVNMPAPFDMEAMTGVVKVLFNRVSEPANVAKVWVPVGIVIVPLLVMVEIVGAVKVLLVRVSAVLRPTKVSVEVGKETVAPAFTILPMTGEVNVLLVRVSSVLRPTKVSVEVGRANVPAPFTMFPITGEVRVLLVRVCVPTKVAILVERAASATDRLGKVTVPLSTEKFWWTTTFPPNEASMPTVRALSIDALPL